MPELHPSDIKNEKSKSAWISKCIGVVKHENPEKNSSQIAGQCFGMLRQYEKKHKERKHKAKGSIVIANEVNKEVMNEAAKAALEYYKNNKKTK